MTSLSIHVSEDSQVGETRRAVTQLCRQQGNDETFSGKAAIVATELARNLFMHAGGGEIIIRTVPHPAQAGLEILALDKGPGIQNPGECMRDGYSTAGTAGNGMGSIQRLSTRFDLFSQPQRGTVVWTRLLPSGAENLPGKTRSFDWSGVSIADARETVCGDAWDIDEQSGIFRAFVVDGLGHGPFAEEAAREAIAVFRSTFAEPAETLAQVNGALFQTRGAAGALLTISLKNQTGLTAGLGNISMRITDGDRLRSLVSENGTLGTGARRIVQNPFRFSPGMLIIMHSDGLLSNWGFDPYPGLAMRSPGLIAGVLYRDFKRGGDDATVVVARHLA